MQRSVHHLQPACGLGLQPEIPPQPVHLSDPRPLPTDHGRSLRRQTSAPNRASSTAKSDHVHRLVHYHPRSRCRLWSIASRGVSPAACARYLPAIPQIPMRRTLLVPVQLRRRTTIHRQGLIQDQKRPTLVRRLRFGRQQDCDSSQPSTTRIPRKCQLNDNCRKSVGNRSDT
jgi:hypothetical protein